LLTVATVFFKKTKLIYRKISKSENFIDFVFLFAVVLSMQKIKQNMSKNNYCPLKN